MSATKLNRIFALAAVAALVVAVSVLAIGCGSDDDDGPEDTPAATVSGRSTVTRAPTPIVAQTATASPAATPASTPEPTAPSADADYDLAFEAALRELDGAPDVECVAVQKTCVAKREEPNRGGPGIALFNESAPQGGGNLLIMGKDPNGEWHFWFGTQHALTPPVYIPGDMRVCSGGSGLNVRSEPDANAQVVQTLADETIVRGEQFVLTEPGDHSLVLQSYEQAFGNGWYRISSPSEGWVYSPYVYYPDVLDPWEGCTSAGLPHVW